MADRYCLMMLGWDGLTINKCIIPLSFSMNQTESLVNTLNATNEPLTETAKEVVNDITAQLSTVTEPVENESIFPNELRTTTFVLQQIEKLVSINNLYNKLVR